MLYEPFSADQKASQAYPNTEKSIWRSEPKHLHCFSLNNIYNELLAEGAGLGIRGVIFDLDGVIVDTEYQHYSSYKEVLEPYGLTLTHDDYKRHFESRGRKTALSGLLPHLSTDIHHQIGQAKDMSFLSAVASRQDLCYPDALALIESLKEKNIPLAIGTAASNGQKLIDMLKLTRLFSHIVTAKDVRHNKPAPDIYLKCMDYLQLPPENVIVIEDSCAGVQAALNAGLWVLQVHRPPHASNI